MTKITAARAAGIAALVVALLGCTDATTQPATTTASAPAVSSTSTTPPGPDTGSPRWMSPEASWNRPAAHFGPAGPELQPYADRLWAHGGGPAPPGTFNIAFGDYSVPTYPAGEATGQARVYQTTWAQQQFPMGVPPGTAVPWNPTWVPGTGNDNILAIVDEATGTVWEIAGVGQLPVNCLNLTNLAANPGDSLPPLCVSDTRTYSNLHTVTDATTTDGRGMGINKLALLTRAVEVQAGSIDHALELSIVGTMFGPPCTPTSGYTAAGAGVSCGFFLPPATKLERARPDIGVCTATQPVTDAERATTVPEGMRFALQITDTAIDRWLDERGYTEPLRSTARIFAVALRDYGWIIAESGCYGMSIETDSATVGPAAPTWRALGIDVTGPGFSDLLAGLITPERIYVVAPPA